MSKENLVEVQGVSKKFCRNLKKSLWYGVTDILGELPIFSGKTEQILRQDEFWAVNNVSFELKRGESLALIGPNGAGKSTLLKLLTGLIKPDKGLITVRGRVGALIELGAGFNPLLTGRENIHVNGAILGLSKKEIEKRFGAIIDFAEIGEFIDAPVQNYSSGMRVRLGFAVAANLNPNVLFVDEVLAVGDVGFRMKCYEHLLRLKANGTSMIVVSHSVDHLSRITDRVVVLDKGENVFDGSLAVGIGKYHHLISKERVGVSNEKSTDCAISSVVLRDEKGNVAAEFSTGDTIVAEITITSTIKIENARLIASIQAPSAGMLASFSTPYTRFEFDVTPPVTKIQLELPNIPLLIGGYVLNLNIYGPNITDFYDRLSPAASFQIVAPPIDTFGFGVCEILNFEHQWKFLE